MTVCTYITAPGDHLWSENVATVKDGRKKADSLGEKNSKEDIRTSKGYR